MGRNHRNRKWCLDREWVPPFREQLAPSADSQPGLLAHNFILVGLGPCAAHSTHNQQN
jgi:hypothetical protein